VRIRPVWIAIPACAAAGIVTYSFVAAQEPAGPAGFYQTKVTPHPSVVAESNASSMRPHNEGRTPAPADGNQLPPNWLPTPGSTVPARLAAKPTPHAPSPKPRMTQPGISDKAEPSAYPASGTMPVTPLSSQPKGRFFPDATSPVRPAAATNVIPPPSVTPVPTVPLDLPPPRVTMEPELPVETSADVEMPKPLAISPPPAEPMPLPIIQTVPETQPASINTTPSVTLTPPPAAPFGTGFPSTPLPARQSPNLIVEAIAPESIGLGQTLTYEIVVKNAGSAPVANVRVEDELPTGVKYLNSDPSAEHTGDRLAWTIGGLDAGAERRIKVMVQPADEGELRSRAVVTFATAAEARIRVTRPRVSVALAAADTVRVGDEVAFQIKVSNTGSGPAQKLVIQAKLSDGLHHPQGGVIEAELENLSAGETKTVTLRAMATKAGPQTCTIVAAADGNPPESANSALNVIEPRLETKLAGPSKCVVRSEPTYTMEMANPGTAGTDPVQAWAVVPDGFEFVSASDGGAFTPANRTIIWRLPGLPAGTNKSVSFKLRAAAPTEGTLKTVAQAVPPTDTASNVQPAGYRHASATRVLEATADTPIIAEGVPALRFEVIDLEDPIMVGQEAVYEIKVQNQGTGPCTGVQIVATLADGTQVTGASGQTTGRGQGQQVVFDPIPTLDMKKEAVYQVRVRGTQAGDHRFKVQVTCDQIKTPIIKEENTRFYKE
jgi:uncharacterized repeat protein (TIGR01451 family)